MFSLTKLEMKQIKRDFKELTIQLELDIEAYEEVNDWEPGYDDSNEESDWFKYHDIECTPKEIAQYELQRYNFGDVKEGDLVLLLPPDTDLPDRNKYKVEYKGTEYVSETGLEPYEPFNDLLLFYTIVFRK